MFLQKIPSHCIAIFLCLTIVFAYAATAGESTPDQEQMVWLAHIDNNEEDDLDDPEGRSAANPFPTLHVGNFGRFVLGLVPIRVLVNNDANGDFGPEAQDIVFPYAPSAGYSLETTPDQEQMVWLAHIDNNEEDDLDDPEGRTATNPFPTLHVGNFDRFVIGLVPVNFYGPDGQVFGRLPLHAHVDINEEDELDDPAGLTVVLLPVQMFVDKEGYELEEPAGLTVFLVPISMLATGTKDE